MKKRELEKFRKLLLARRSAILEELGLKKGSLGSTVKEASGDLSTYSYHMADQGTDAMEREKSFYFASKTGRFLYHIDEALRRIEDKTYGKCLGCDKDISPERLEAVPHARFCITCKEKEEQREAAENR
jgi:RNA polymerase-binding protein DksA